MADKGVFRTLPPAQVSCHWFNSTTKCISLLICSRFIPLLHNSPGWSESGADTHRPRPHFFALSPPSQCWAASCCWPERPRCSRPWTASTMPPDGPQKTRCHPPPPLRHPNGGSDPLWCWVWIEKGERALNTFLMDTVGKTDLAQVTIMKIPLPNPQHSFCLCIRSSGPLKCHLGQLSGTK